MSTKYEDRCQDFFGLTIEELLDRYTDGPKHQDPLIKEFGAGEIRQFGNTSYYYMIVECNAMPGIRVAGIWDNEIEDPFANRD